MFLDVAMEERPNAQARKISAVWQTFFRRARKRTGSCYVVHFWRATVSLAAMQGRRSMRKLEVSYRHHSKIFLHAEKVYAQGHTLVVCASFYSNVVIPLAVRLWAVSEYCNCVLRVQGQ